eukprot:Clim_evm4s202 gene=Clim_evmTU4s202
MFKVTDQTGIVSSSNTMSTDMPSSDWEKKTKDTYDTDTNASEFEGDIRYKALFAAMLGFFGDSFTLFSISAATPYLEDVYTLTDRETGILDSLSLWGAVAGQLFFGYMADKIGRRSLYLLTGLMILIGETGSCLSQTTSTMPVWAMIGIFRVITGFGVGGEYPLSASVAAESCPAKKRGKLLALVFATQPLGFTVAAALPVILDAAGLSSQVIWRVTIGAALLPVGTSLILRYQMEESKSFTHAHAREKREAKKIALIEESAKKITSDGTQLTWFAKFRIEMQTLVSVYGKDVAGTALTWFLFDMVTYGNGLANSQVASSFGITSKSGKTQWNFAFNALGVPSGFAAALTLDRWGRVNIMGGSFIALTVLYAVLAGAYDPLVNHHSGNYAMAVLYGLTNMVSFFGPGTMTYVIPGEYFPSARKAKLDGFSAASGKIGAALSTYAFHVLGVRVVFFISFGAALVGAIASFTLVPRYGVDDIIGIQMRKEDLFTKERTARTARFCGTEKTNLQTA